MKKRVMTVLLAGALILSVSGCTIGNLQIEISDSSSSTGNTVSKDESKDNGSKDPDDAKSFKEYVELKFGPVAGNFDDDVTVEDEKTWGILEDKEYGFQYMINLENGAEYNECNTNFANQYKGYIHSTEDAALDAIEEEEGVSIEFNFLESEFIVAEVTLNDTSKAPEVTEKIGKIYEKYDNRHFFDRYLVTAKSTDGTIIGTYLIWHEYEAEE